MVKVAYIGEPGSYAEALVFDVKTTRPSWADQFRPIITEAERRREDRIKALNGFIGGFMKSASGDYSNLGEALFEWLDVLDKVNDTRN